jgi:hypothetical protein
MRNDVKLGQHNRLKADSQNIEKLNVAKIALGTGQQSVVSGQRSEEQAEARNEEKAHEESCVGVERTPRRTSPRATSCLFGEYWWCGTESASSFSSQQSHLAGTRRARCNNLSRLDGAGHQCSSWWRARAIRYRDDSVLQHRRGVCGYWYRSQLEGGGSDIFGRPAGASPAQSVCCPITGGLPSPVKPQGIPMC